MAKAMMGAAQAAPDDQNQSEAPTDENAGEEPRTASTPANPIEQQDYEQFLNNCFKLMYSSDNDFASLKMILQQLASPKDPGATLANITVTIVHKAEDSARASGLKPDSSTILEAGKTVLEDVASLAFRARLQDYTEAQLEGAFYRAIDQYRAMSDAAGTLDKAAAQKEFAAMVQAEKDGTLDRVVPGATEAGNHLKPAVDKVIKASGDSANQPLPSQQPQPQQQGMMPPGGAQ